MAIYRILQRSTFRPEDVSRMEHAYELALGKLGLTDRNDPITEIVARRVIEAAQTGEQSSLRICDIALEAIRHPQ